MPTKWSFFWRSCSQLFRGTALPQKTWVASTGVPKVGEGHWVAGVLEKVGRLSGRGRLFAGRLESQGSYANVTRSPSSVPFYPFLGEGSPTKIGYRKRAPFF